MLKVISFKICPFVQRVTGLLEAKGIEYQMEYISLSDKPDWFLDISPNGQVPVVVTESGQALFESEAIVEYLDERFPVLESDASLENRALNRAWSYLAAKHYLVQCSTMRSPTLETLQERQGNLNKAFAKVEKALAQSDKEGPYFNGEALGNVDVAWLPLLHRADIIRRHTGYDQLDGFPRVQRWQQTLMQTGLAEGSVAADFEDRFTEFYLSEKTYLGNPQCTSQHSGNQVDVCKTGACC